MARIAALAALCCGALGTPAARAQAATSVGDVVAALRSVALGQISIAPEALQLALEGAVAGAGTSIASLETLLVELAVQWTVQIDPLPVANLFVDFAALSGPPAGPWEADLVLAEAVAWENDLGLGAGACGAAGATVEDLGGGVYWMETEPLALPPVDLFGTTVAISNVALVTMIHAQPGEDVAFLAQGWVELAAMEVEPPVDLALVEAVLINGRALAPAERALAGIGDSLDACP